MTFQARWASARNTPSSSWPSPRVSAKAWNPSFSWWAWSRTCASECSWRILGDFWGFSLGKMGNFRILGDFGWFSWGIWWFSLRSGDFCLRPGRFYGWIWMIFCWGILVTFPWGWVILDDFSEGGFYDFIWLSYDFKWWREFHGDDWCLLGLFIGDWMGF